MIKDGVLFLWEPDKPTRLAVMFNTQEKAAMVSISFYIPKGWYGDSSARVVLSEDQLKELHDYLHANGVG